ncbi:MAG: hypothetical protein WAN48_10880 [Actinomycetes bacterium]
MKRVHAFALVIPALVLGLAGPAAAASNPAGSGQPGTANPAGVACGDAGATAQPPGFASPGFAVAETHYAGSPGTGSLNSGNAHAVSEYDIACYQFTHNH